MTCKHWNIMKYQTLFPSLISSLRHPQSPSGGSLRAPQLPQLPPAAIAISLRIFKFECKCVWCVCVCILTIYQIYSDIIRYYGITMYHGITLFLFFWGWMSLEWVHSDMNRLLGHQKCRWNRSRTGYGHGTKIWGPKGRMCLVQPATFNSWQTAESLSAAWPMA